MNPEIPKKIRLDSSLYCKPGWVYSISVVANFKRQYFLKHKLNMEIIECLKNQRKKSGCRVFVYCLMPEHLHFLCSVGPCARNSFCSVGACPRNDFDSVKVYPHKNYAHKGLHYPDKAPSIIDFVNQFKGKSTTIAWKYGIKRNLWQKRCYDHILRTNEDVRKSGEYILNNPVRRGLVEDWHEYPYCGYLDEIDL